MQFDHALDRIVLNILLANPHFGTTYFNKVDISDSFYRIVLKPEDISKLAVIFPTKLGCIPLVEFPLVLPMGWINSPLVLCSSTETLADLTNQ